jgi:hypothetical protein
MRACIDREVEGVLAAEQHQVRRPSGLDQDVASMTGESKIVAIAANGALAAGTAIP